jgi:hypothetical protein
MRKKQKILFKMPPETEKSKYYDKLLRRLATLIDQRRLFRTFGFIYNRKFSKSNGGH